MTQDEYMENLYKRFEKHFEIEKEVAVLEERINIFARHSSIEGRTFITKHDIIDRCESYEYCYIKKTDDVTEEEISAYGEFLKRIVDESVKPGKDHMSTYVTGVIICNSIDDHAKKAVEIYRYSKAYQFYLKGWCDVRLVCVNMGNNEIITNKAGKQVKKVYQLTP